MEKQTDKFVNIDDFFTFYEKMKEEHPYNDPNYRFGVQFIDCVFGPPDCIVKTVTLREISASEDILAKIPDLWKTQKGNSLEITITKDMDDGYASLRERFDFLLNLGK